MKFHFSKISEKTSPDDSSNGLARVSCSANQQWTGGNFTMPWWVFETPALFNDPPMRDEDWVRHHSWLRHLPEPTRFYQFMYGLWPIVAWCTLVSVLVGIYAEILQPKPGWPVAVSTAYIQPFILTSFAVALLLVFRANSSYDRWWEARRAFGNMYNCVRNLSRMTSAWLGQSDPATNDEILKWASILGAAAATFLRDDPDFLLEHADKLSSEEMKWVLTMPQPPVAAMQVISNLLRQCSTLQTYERCELERQLASFDMVLGACERIRRQCIPLAYTRQTSRFIVAYLTFMPFGLWAYTEWLTIPVMTVLSLLLIGIENIGIQLEQPMMVLPLSSLASGCRAAVEGVAIAQTGAVRFGGKFRDTSDIERGAV